MQQRVAEERRADLKYEYLHIRAKSTQPLASPWSFASLIHPISLEQFCGEYWGQRPLRIERSASDFYRDLFGLAELERYLSMDELFMRHSITTPSREYGTPDPPPASISEVYERLLQGQSLRLRRMECLLNPSAPILSLLRNMELTLQHPRDSLSCYVAPPAAQGLGPHHDETEIFTLQISGTKRWRLFHRVDTDQPGIHDPDQLTEAAHDFVLEAGDLFYLPRGYVHDVITTGVPSFSLTIVFSPFKWSAVLDLLVARLASTSAFMEPMPAGALLGETRPDSFRQQLEARVELIRQELSKLSVDAVVDDLAARHVRRLTMPPNTQIEALFSLEAITLETQLEKRPGIAFHLASNGDKIRLILPGGYTVEASGRAERAFRHILAAGRPFRVSEMHQSLSDAAKLALAKKLVGCGLLRFVSAERDPH